MGVPQWLVVDTKSKYVPRNGWARAQAEAISAGDQGILGISNESSTGDSGASVRRDAMR